MFRVLCIAMLLFASALPAAHASGLKPWKGGTTPSLELKDLDGRLYRLADYRGKVVLVNFWATWCEPCRQEMPSIERLRAALAGRPFVVLAVNLDEPEARIRKFLGQTAVDYPILLDPGSRAAKSWNARILPASFVIGRNGRVRYSVSGELDWDSQPVARTIADLIGSR